jgi:hypothetical protein
VDDWFGSGGWMGYIARLITSMHLRRNPNNMIYRRTPLLFAWVFNKSREQHLIAQRVLLLLASTMRRKSEIRALDSRVPCSFRSPVEPAGL